ncbi:MAG: POTRA domain-containing protein, partial [Terriglobia bacterium]
MKLGSLALLLALAAPAEEAPFIQSLQIRGTRRPVELETHAGQSLDRAQLERDVRRLWETGWFEDVRVEAEENSEGIHLVFTLRDKPRLYLRRVVLEPERGRRKLNLPAGTAVDKVLARRVAAALRRQLVEEGHADAQVEAELIPTGFQEADLRLRVEPGPRYQVAEVRFSGQPGMNPKELREALRATRRRRLLPGIPGLWGGWRLLPPFSQQGLEADRERLRGFYLSRGYFEAEVRLAGVEFDEKEVTVTFAVDAGPRYRVRRLKLTGSEAAQEFEPDLRGEFSPQTLCACLLEAQRNAESAGVLDFSARLEIEPAESPPWAGLVGEDWSAEDEEQAASAEQLLSAEEGDGGSWVNLTATVEAGPPHRVRRIEFRGHRSFSDATLRRAWELEEGEPFDPRKLRRSLARMNQLGFFEPLSSESVTLIRHSEERQVDVTVWLEEAKRGRWSVSGPLGPAGLFNPFQFSVSSRLPGWGRGALELSTYYATFSLLAFSQPVVRVLSVVPETRLLPLVSIRRPYLPGQRWQSGFLFAPQLGPEATLRSYALTHARQAALGLLEGETPGTPGLRVPVVWRVEEEGAERLQPAGHLFCEAPKPRLRWLR